MDIFSFFTLFGGLAFFLYGMTVMSSGLEKVAGGKLESTLKKMTSNPLKSLLLGAGITIAIQSSSAMTVMLVGLVNSGIMDFSQTIGVIMGSNIGTTLTAWILSLTGIQSDNIIIKLLKPESFAPIVAFIGIILIMLNNTGKKKDVGKIMLGFSVLMYGMQLMSSSVSPLADSPSFANMLTAFTNPLLGVLVGTVFTGVIQSSAASVGILQALSLTGSVSFGMAIPIIMGQNIGTCVTAILSSIGVNKNAKRVSVIHICFNIIGTIILLVLFYGTNAFVHFSFINKSINPVQIALVHSVFNILTTLILLPFNKVLAKIACIVVKQDEVKETPELLDERLIATPAIAIARCHDLTTSMGQIAQKSFTDAIKMLSKYDQKIADEIEVNEDKTDYYEDKLGTYLVKVSQKSLSKADSNEATKLLHIIGDFERIGDHACNLIRTAKEISDKKIEFSASANKEIETMSDALIEILDITMKAFVKNDVSLAKQVEPLEQVIDKLQIKLKDRHVSRLQNGECTIVTGFVFNDLLTNYERVADHCSNIAVCIIQMEEGSFDTHEYLSNVKSHGDDTFDSLYYSYKKKYSI